MLMYFLITLHSIYHLLQFGYSNMLALYFYKKNMIMNELQNMNPTVIFCPPEAKVR